MAMKSFLVVAFILFCAFCSTPITGRHVTEHEKGERIVKSINGNSSTNFVPLLSQQQNVQGYNHFSIWRTISGNWHGVRANISVWSIPHVQPDSFSASLIGAVYGKEAIAAGFHVYPSMYNNDTELHFHTYTNLDVGNSRGCYNTDQCSGFVVAKGANLLPGNRVAPLSVVDGEQRYISLRLNKEANGDWSLYREDLGGPINGGTLLGHWPKSLFKNLNNHADSIQMGGVVYYPHDEPSPPMGNGHVAEDGEGKAAWFKNVAVFDKDDNNAVLKFPDNMKWYNDKIVCYDISNLLDSDSFATYNFYYGGPSGCKDDESN